jgi:hypothetical protein
MNQAGCTIGAGARRVRTWLAIWLAVGGGTVAYATLPVATDEADTQDPGTLQIEAGASYETDSECDHSDVPIALTYGVMPRVDAAGGSKISGDAPDFTATAGVIWVLGAKKADNSR